MSAGAAYGRDMTGTDPRRALGAQGEQAAAEHLERAGYEIVERNFRTRLGELDLIAADSRHIVFCEVKTRVTASRRPIVHPLQSVGHRKRRRLRLLASEWLRSRDAPTARPHRPELRFDAIGIILDPTGRIVELEHVEGAF